MERINYNLYRLHEILDKLNPQNSGIFFSIFLHLSILLFALGLPNIFGPKDIYVPSIIPIEIVNISESTNIQKSKINEKSKEAIPKTKKFNSSENTEVQKKFELIENSKNINEDNQPLVEVKEKIVEKIQEKKNIEIKQKEPLQTKSKIETIKTNDIKPKIKPKPIKPNTSLNIPDVQIDQTIKKEIKNEKKEVISKPKPKPEEDFSIASMLKDLRNEKSNNINKENVIEEEEQQTGNESEDGNDILSISEIDLLRQQLSSCWNAPAGAVINIGDKVTISAKVQQNMKVFSNSVRIVDTNISKSNPFYGPITDSAMRTLLNPECTPLKLPKDKYNLWKNLTITFDYSIMKGY